ncbi:MAG: DNA replication and repair protein RecF [Candidatus Roizmanbacteria bacterium]|nr:DNA replication and repair protein RecF [Candidatus Roizmanbacteria bacterium]
MRTLTVKGFRSFSHSRTFTFDTHYSLIAGHNAAGKTNILEAVYAALYGIGFRTRSFEELLSFGTHELSLQATFSDETKDTVAVVHVIQRGETLQKSYSIQGNRHTIGTYRNRLPGAVLFEPEDLRLVTETPDLRRSYLDKVLSLHNQEYLYALNTYNKALYRRNKTLEQMAREGKHSRDLLDPWNDILEQQAAIIQPARSRLIDRYNEPIKGVPTYSLTYQQNSFTKERAQERFELDCRVRRTTNGPQRDDFVIDMVVTGKVDEERKSVAAYGARSQQRLAVLWLKAHELSFITNQTGIKPLFLLDDVFSELDADNSERVVDLASTYQTIITTAHRESVPTLPKGSIVIDMD